MKSRNELPKLIKENGVGIEIGTQTGLFSEVILNNSKLLLLYSLDCWKHQYGYDDIANHGNLRQLYYKLKTILRLKKFGNRSKIIQAFSSEILSDYDYLEEMDFVYIDGDHTYEGCKLDLEIWFPRVRKGGILSGHDYFDGDIETCKNCGVKRAVDEMVKKYDLKLNTTEDNPKSWWIIK